MLQLAEPTSNRQAVPSRRTSLTEPAALSTLTSTNKGHHISRSGLPSVFLVGVGRGVPRFFAAVLRVAVVRTLRGKPCSLFEMHSSAKRAPMCANNTPKAARCA